MSPIEALNRIAQTWSSDWPERCQENVRVAREALAAPVAPAEPIDMVLYCPACGMQHIDKADEVDPFPTPEKDATWWGNPPHRSHLCNSCGHIWRPADVPTNGVTAAKTAGKADSPMATPVAPSPSNGWPDTDAERSAPAAPALVPLTPAATDVLAERRRQTEIEGWTMEHDDRHTGGGMAIAAACYALAGISSQFVDVGWLWEWTGWADSWFKPKDKRHNLVRAGALILAEIERMDRAAHRIKP